MLGFGSEVEMLVTPHVIAIVSFILTSASQAVIREITIDWFRRAHAQRHGGPPAEPLPVQARESVQELAREKARDLRIPDDQAAALASAVAARLSASPT